MSKICNRLWTVKRRSDTEIKAPAGSNFRACLAISIMSYDLIVKVMETSFYFILFVNNTSEHVMKSTTIVMPIDKLKLEGGSAKELHDTLLAILPERLVACSY